MWVSSLANAVTDALDADKPRGLISPWQQVLHLARNNGISESGHGTGDHKPPRAQHLTAFCSRRLPAPATAWGNSAIIERPPLALQRDSHQQQQQQQQQQRDSCTPGLLNCWVGFRTQVAAASLRVLALREVLLKVPLGASID